MGEDYHLAGPCDRLLLSGQGGAKLARRKYDLSTPEGAAAYLEHLRVSCGQHRLYDKRCAECGKEFVGWALTRYCSPACRQRHFYWKGRGQRRDVSDE
jgi:hypothetical protein